MLTSVLISAAGACAALSRGVVMRAGRATGELATRARAAHILVNSESLARDIEAQIARGDADFADLAEMLSTCESNGDGGELGWISAGGQMVPEFELAALSCDPGEMRVFESPFGWHVLRVSEVSTLPLTIEPTELHARLGGPATPTIVDVRGPEELDRAPLLAGAFHHAYNDWQEWAPRAIDGDLAGLHKDAETVIMDHRGGRAERIAQYLAQNGFGRARYLRGGINAYAEEADPSVPVYLESEGDCNTCKEH